MKSRAGALWRKLDVTDRWNPVPGKYGGVGQGIPILSQCCDRLMASKTRLDQRAGRIREQMSSVTMHDICEMERTALELLVDVFEQCLAELLQVLQLLAANTEKAEVGVLVRRILAAVALMAKHAAYVCCAMFVIVATREMSGRGEPAVTSFDELFPTAHGVQLQPATTKRRQCSLPFHSQLRMHSPLFMLIAVNADV